MLCHTALWLGVRMVSDGYRPDSEGYVDSEVVPVRCHWERERHQDLCDSVLASAAESWTVQVDELGFQAPMPDEDGILDIYLTSEYTYGGAYTYGPYEDEDDTDGRMGCHAYIAIDPSVGEAWMPTFVAHEFNHVLQYATDFVEPTAPLWEGTASAAERWTYPEEFDTSYLADFQADPWAGLLEDGYTIADVTGEHWSYYEYGTAMWIFHLDGVWGDGTGTMGAALWNATIQEGWRNEPDVLDAWNTVTGDWRLALLDLSVERARVGTDEEGDWAGFSGRGRLSVDDEVDAAQLPAEVVPAWGVYPTGVTYVRLTDLEPGSAVDFEIVDENGGEWGVVVIEGAAADYAEGTTLSWTAGADEVVFGAVYFGPPEFDGDDRGRAAEVTLHLSRSGAPDSDADSGSADTGQPDIAGETKDQPRPPRHHYAGGWAGCAATHGAGGGIGALFAGLLAAVRRARRVPVVAGPPGADYS